MTVTRIENETVDFERAYYNSRDCEFYNITCEGPTDGESSFKECHNIKIHNSKIALRYCLWHDDGLVLDNCNITETCRAPLWYGNDIDMNDTVIDGVKPYRECSRINIVNSRITSEEPFWNCHDINIKDSGVHGFYAFMNCTNIKLENVNFSGKYSFQYDNNLVIENSNLDTKDAFWHSKNVIVRNCIVKGEYLGWYSENLTLINCTITGTQPLCYCKGLKLINCTMEGCDLSFEYSEVEADLKGSIKSIKNPLVGNISVDQCEEIIIDENDRSEGRCSIIIR